MGERSHALCWCFSYKNFAGTGPIVRLSGFCIRNPGGQDCGVFAIARALSRVVAPVFFGAQAFF
jgi:hypothetical protein